ncbi:uncharacterized protein LY89DRAFT_680734 [Mollisia scopiformis]|uniref:Uncharacterized protein n=1 Tax=Mollisia scopiformis TaxID=149040 RepID=A0A194XS86_MOLSC|nr:uncharacterized protein LY89DRAFT_680734 [Mollisia scopiformis]KUJ22592.1 hypothetical protein LY89DRAFT_680734 [Mollisia scopiformis]
MLFLFSITIILPVIGLIAFIIRTLLSKNETPKNPTTPSITTQEINPPISPPPLTPPHQGKK